MNKKNNSYIIIGIMGKSASGKNTVLKILKDLSKRHDELKLKVNFPKETTSREKRAEETDEDYNFISKLPSNEKWLCTSCYNKNWFYGYSESSFCKNKINIIILNAQYYEQLSKRSDVILRTIYLNVANEILEKRQISRLLKSANMQEVKNFIRIYNKRIKQDIKDFDRNKRKYDYILPNNTSSELGRCAHFIENLVKSM